jgi:hypothetical protein
MADEIVTLKNVIEQICVGNDRKKSILDIKQSEWIEIKKKNTSSMINQHPKHRKAMQQ